MFFLYSTSCLFLFQPLYDITHFRENVPDSGQEHPANGDNSLFMSAAGFQFAVALLAFGILVGLDHSVGDLNKNGLEVSGGPRNAGRFHFAVALVIAGTATCPGNQMLCGRKHRHIRANLGKDGNSGHRITGQAGSSPDQAEQSGIRFSQTKDLLFNIFLMCVDFIDVPQAFFEFRSLLTGYRSVNGSLNLLDGMLATFMDKRCNVELLARMLQNVADDGTCGLPKHVRKHIVELQVGNSEAVERTVFLSGEHIGQFHAVTHKVPEMTNIRGRDKTGLDYVAHKQVTNPLGVFAGPAEKVV